MVQDITSMQTVPSIPSNVDGVTKTPFTIAGFSWSVLMWLWGALNYWNPYDWHGQKIEYRSSEVWRDNQWLEMNFFRFSYIVLCISVLLQQFPQTEPVVVGFFYITLISMFAGKCHSYWSHDKRTIQWAAICALIGVALQVYLIGWQWQALVDIDIAAKWAREQMFGDHRYLGWGVLSFFTILCATNNWRRGWNTFFWQEGQQYPCAK